MAGTSDPSTSSEQQVDLSGRELGDYRLLRRLGRGAMAEVYLAEQQSLARQVAVKILKSHLAEDESYVRRFQHEAKAAASLVHPNIVQIYEVGRVDRIQFISQEYVPGLNLRQTLARNGPLDARQAVTVMRQVAAALHKAGQQGIVHRDIKPDNIMLSTDGQVKVADFGLARVSGAGELNLTQVGVTMGTPLYMSPEQAEGRRLDPRSDLYSFGVTCYHMLAGHPPFQAETALAVAVQHVRAQAERLENLRPDLPGGLCRIVHRMLAKEPADRFPGGAELLRDLRGLRIEGAAVWEEADETWGTAELAALADARAEATQRLDELMKTSALVVRRRRLRWRMLAVGAVVAFLLGAGFAWWLNRPERSSPSTGVARLDTAEAQYVQAVWLDSEAGWLAVADNFPDDAHYRPLVDQQLARLYLNDARLGDAEPRLLALSQLTAPDQSAPRAYGLAGLAIIAAERGDPQRAQRHLAQLGPLKAQLDPQMQALLDRHFPPKP